MRVYRRLYIYIGLPNRGPSRWKYWADLRYIASREILTKLSLSLPLLKRSPSLLHTCNAPCNFIVRFSAWLAAFNSSSADRGRHHPWPIRLDLLKVNGRSIERVGFTDRQKNLAAMNAARRGRKKKRKKEKKNGRNPRLPPRSRRTYTASVIICPLPKLSRGFLPYGGFVQAEGTSSHEL